MIKRLFILLLVVSPMLAMAQAPGTKFNIAAKVKEAKSKGKTQNAPPHFKAKKKQSSTKKRRSAVVNTPKKATYLFVNNSTAINHTTQSSSHLEGFSVSTDGENWGVRYLPSWCKITYKGKEQFTISYEANPEHSERSDWFEVYANDKRVRVNLSQSGKPIDVKAKINRIRLLQNVHDKLFNTVAIVNVSLSGAKGFGCICKITVTDNKDKKIRTFDKRFSQNGFVYAATAIYPNIDEISEYVIKLELPNNVMIMPRKKCILHINIGVIYNGKYISHIETLEIKAKRNIAGIVKTKFTKRQAALNSLSSGDKNVFRPSDTLVK